jgi:hypothetical protein
LRRSVSICVRLVRSAIGLSMSSVEPAQRTPLGAQAVEGLRAGDLVHEVQVDVDEVGLAVLALHDEMVVPDLLGEGTRAIGDRGDVTAHALLAPCGRRYPATTNSATGRA